MDSQYVLNKTPGVDLVDSNLHQDNKRTAFERIHSSEQVFQTPLLLEEILANLNRNQLLNLRSVNQAWNAGALKLLRKTVSLFIGKQNSSTYLQSEAQLATPSFSPQIPDTKLYLLWEAMARSRELALIFPCTRFAIGQLQLQSGAHQDFLSNFGHLIQSFSVYFSSDRPHEGCIFLDLVTNLLYSKLPNLVRFDIKTTLISLQAPGYLQSCALETGACQVSRSLPKLKQLAYSGSTHVPILKFLLKAGVNAKQISVLVWQPSGENVVQALLAEGKASALSSLNLILCKELLEPIARLSEQSSRIKTLVLFLREQNMSKKWNIMMSNAVNKLIISNALSLQSLTIFPFLFHPTFYIRQLPKLQFLTLYYAGSCHPYFPTKLFKISRVFPQIKALNVQLKVCEGMDERLFQESLLGASYEDEVLTLRSIDFDKQRGEMSTLNVLKLFPNLVSVNLGILSNISQAFSSLWNLAHLKILKFRLIRESGYIDEVNDNFVLELESALTGFSKETCKELETKCHTKDFAMVESLRINPSMLDAKCLKELHIKIDDFNLEGSSQGYCTLLSQIMGQYAFDACPRVQVHVQVYAITKENVAALMNAVRPVLSFVTSCTESRDFDNRSHIRYACSSCRL